MKPRPLLMRLFRLLLPALLPVCLAATTPEAPPPRPGALRSADYRVEVDGRPVFTERFADVHIATFTQAATQQVVVRAREPITRFNVSPHSANLPARAEGDALHLTVDRPGQLVVTVNGGEEILLFAEPPEPDAPRPGQPGVVNVRDLGIDATGGRVETARLQAAIDRTAAAAGTLYFPAGTYLTGTLALKSNLTLYLAEGACLLGSTDPADYPVDAPDGNLQYDPHNWTDKHGVDIVSARTIANSRLILVQDARHVRVAGRGVIDGRGKATRRTSFRPQLVHLRNAADVTFEGVTLRNAAFYNCHILMCDHVTFRNIKIVSDRSVPNTDGFNPDSSQDVLLEDSFLLCGDDTVAIKSSGTGDLLRSVERVTVRNCRFISTTSAMKMGTESFAPFHRDILFQDIDVILADRAINLSCTDGAFYEDVRFIDIRVERIAGNRIRRPFAIHIDRRTPDSPSTGHIHRVLLRNFAVEQADGFNPGRLTGLDAEADVRDIRFENFSIGGRVRLDAADAHVQIDPFVSGVTFAATPSPP